MDSLVEAGGLPPPRVMKIDVEGGERDVLLGASRTISTHTPSIVFEADANLVRFGYGRRDLFALLASLADYRFYFLRETELGPAELDPENGTFTDVLAVPASRAAAVT